jgi:hypothetical protein
MADYRVRMRVECDLDVSAPTAENAKMVATRITRETLAERFSRAEQVVVTPFAAQLLMGSAEKPVTGKTMVTRDYNYPNVKLLWTQHTDGTWTFVYLEQP